MPRPSFPSRAELDRQQWQRWLELAAQLRCSNPFQSAKLSRLPAELPREPDWDSFACTVPFTTKQELVEDQAHHPLFGTNLTYPADRYCRYHQTSGTAGRPLRWLDTAESWSAMVDLWVHIYQVAGVTAADQVYFAFTFGPFLGFWLAFDAGQKLGCLCLPGGGLSSVARVRAIYDLQVTVLCCTPTYAIRLGEVAADENLDPSRSRVRAIIVAGEPGGSLPATRARIETLWPGARVYDHHGMTEVGPVTHECPQQPGVLHVMEEAYRPEILDPRTHCPSAPGETGELILTTLARTGSPLLRYRTGDLVRCPSPGVCVCGRADLALTGGILGRVDDMVVVRGVNIYPSSVDEVVQRVGGIAEYRVRLHTDHALTELSLEVEPLEPFDGLAVAEQLGKELHLAFALRIPVSPVPPGSLPRFEMKARRWMRS